MQGMDSIGEQDAVGEQNAAEGQDTTAEHGTSEEQDSAGEQNITEGQIKIGGKATEDVVCGNCNKTVPWTEAHSFRGKDNNDIYLCEDCKKLTDEQFAKEEKNSNYIGAVLLGLLAAAVGGAAWYFIEILTSRIIGYVAWGLGYLVGMAVVFGSGKKRGTGLQVISAVITLIAIFGASYFAEIHFVNKYVVAELAKEGKELASYLWISPFNADVIKDIISPIGIFIWVIGIYLAFRMPKKRSI